MTVVGTGLCRITMLVVVIGVWKMVWYGMVDEVRLGVLSDDEAQGGCRLKYLYPARRIPESSRYCLLIMIGSSSKLSIFPVFWLIVHRKWWQHPGVSSPFSSALGLAR